MRPTRLVEWTLVAASFAILALNLWITPRGLLPILNIGRWGLFALAALLGLAAQASRGGVVKTPWGSLPILVFVVITFASVLWSVAPAYTLARAVSVALLVGGVFVFGAGGSALAGGGLLISSMVWVNLVIVGVSAVMVFSVPKAWASGLYQGPFGNPNGLAGALVLTLPFVLGRALSVPRTGRLRRLRRSRALLIATSAASVGLILLSRSRTVIVTMLVVLMIFALAMVKQKLEALVVASFLAGLTFMLVPAQAVAPVVNMYVYKGETGDILFSRRESLKTTWQMAKERPISGHGFGVAADTMPGQTWRGGLSTPLGFGREKTNSYLGLVEEIGLVGLLPLVAGLGYGVYRSIKRFAAVKWSDPIRMALLATVLSGLVHVNGEAWLTSAGSLEAFWFWWTAGVLFSPSFWRYRGPRPMSAGRWP